MKLSGKKTIGKHEMPKEEQERTVRIPSCSDGRMSQRFEISESSWMDRRLLPIPGQPHDDRHLLQYNLAAAEPAGKKTPSYWYPMMTIGKLDRCEREEI